MQPLSLFDENIRKRMDVNRSNDYGYDFGIISWCPLDRTVKAEPMKIVGTRPTPFIAIFFVRRTRRAFPFRLS